MQTYDREFLIRVSYLEVYNESIRDLFKPDDTDLKLHEHPTQGFYVKATEVMVSSEEEIMQLMDSGEAHRHVGQTNMNEKSSRSHTLFRITIESKVEIPDDGEAGSDSDDEDHQAGLCIRAATLNLVDLAGSERVGDTGAEGVRLKEAGKINKSLLTLASVIKKLADGDSGHIPYRDSQLTKLLQPSLGGNGKTSMICAVTPASSFIDETRSTLMFADRAKDVKNSATINEIMDDKALLLQSKKEVAALQKQLQMMKSGSGVSTEDIEALVQQKMQAEEEKEALKSQLSHMSAFAMGGSSTPSFASSRVDSRRASNPVAAASRRVTYGNYTNRTDNQRRISTLPMPSMQFFASTPDTGSPFSKIKSFQDFKPVAAWDDDDEDRDLGVLQEFEEQEEEDLDETAVIGMDESTRYDDRDDRIEQLQLQLSESQRTVADLNEAAEKQDSSTQDFAKLQDEVVELRAENEGQGREIAGIEAEYSRVVEESAGVHEQLKTAEEAAANASTAEAKVKELQATLAEHKVKLMAATSNTAGAEELAAAKATSVEHLASIDKLERDRYEMKQATKEQATKLKSVQDAAKASDKKVEDATQELGELRASIDQGEKKATAANTQAKQLQDELSELKATNTATKCELKERQVELKKEQSRNDKGSADRGASKLAVVEAKLKETLKEKAALSSEKSTAQREARDEKKKAEKLQAALDRKDTTSGLKGLRAKVERLQNELAESQRVQEGLRLQLKAAELQCSDMLTTMETTQQEVIALRSGKETAETRAAELQVSSDGMSHSVASLQSEVAESKSTCIERDGALASLKEEHQSVVDAKTQADSQIAQLTAVLTGVQKQADDHQASAAELKGSSAQLEADLAELFEQFKVLAVEKDEQTGSISSISKERDDLAARLAEIESVAADAVSTVESQQAELDALRQGHADAASTTSSTSSAEAAAEIAKLQSKRKSDELLKDSLRKQVSKLGEDMEMLEDGKARLNELIHVKEKMISDECARADGLEAKITRITNKVKSARPKDTLDDSQNKENASIPS